MRVIDSVGEALRQFVIQLGVDIGLQREHVGAGHLFVAGEPLPDALVAVGRGPFERERRGVVVRGDARVGGGKDATRGVERGGQGCEGDHALPLVCAVRDGHAHQSAGTLRDVSDRLIADVALIVCVDHVERGRPPLAHGSLELLPVARGVQRIDGNAAGELRIVDRPAQREGARLVRRQRRNHRAVVGAQHIELLILAEAHLDGFVVALHGAPRGCRPSIRPARWCAPRTGPACRRTAR